MNQTQYFNSSDRRKALDTLYEISANEKPRYIGLHWNWYRMFFELHFTPPKSKDLTVIKIHGTI